MDTYVIAAIVATGLFLIFALNAILRKMGPPEPPRREPRRWVRSLWAMMLMSVVGCNGGAVQMAASGTSGSGGATTTVMGSGGGSGGSMSDDAGPDATVECLACPASVCPSGAYSVCENGDTTTACCQEGACIQVCSLPAGILTHDCPVPCSSTICAISPNGNETCCKFGGLSPNPCDDSVP